MVADLTAEMPAAQAIALVLGRFSGVLRDTVDGVLDGTDAEFLHDFRIAVRRTRSVLKLTGDLLPAGLAEKYPREFRWLGDLTTTVRDLDVYLLNSALSAADLAPFVEFLRQRRAAERRRLVPGLRSARFRTLLADWNGDLAGVPATGPAIGEVAPDRVRQAHARVHSIGRTIAADSPADRVHSLRKRCKELRYLLEIFRPLYEPAWHRKFVRELKQLQDCLGEFQDSEVQRAYATEMLGTDDVPAATLAALRELAVRLDDQQSQARARLPIVLGEFRM